MTRALALPVAPWILFSSSLMSRTSSVCWAVSWAKVLASWRPIEDSGSWVATRSVVRWTWSSTVSSWACSESRCFRSSASSALDKELVASVW